MRYVVDDELRYFDAWSGGRSNLEELMTHPEAYEYVSGYIDEYCEQTNEPPSMTTINDILWFEMWGMLEEGGFVNECHEWIDDEEEEEED